MDNKRVTIHGVELRKKILDFLKSREERISNVTYQEIANAFGMSSASVAKFHVDAMVEEGTIEKTAKSRSIKVRR